MTPAVSILIVTYNSSHVIGPCLEALGTHPDTEVIVYDNHSVDDTIALVEHGFPSVHVIAGAENSGFAKGVNAAFSASSGSRIMLLNPDAVLEHTSLRLLLDDLDSVPGGVVAPMVRHPEGLVRVASAGRFPTAWRMFTHYFWLSRLPLGLLDGHYLLLSSAFGQERVMTDWVTGACLVLDRSTWLAVNGLDERWFMYAEDIDLCWRIKAHGGDVVIDPEAHVTHLVGSSDSEAASTPNSMWIVNLYDFFALRISRGRIHNVWWGLVVGTGLTLRSFVFDIQAVLSQAHAAQRRRSAREFRAHARAVLHEVGKYGRG